MSDPTRRQIMQMADEVGITDYADAARLVRLALAVFRPTPTPVPVSERLPGDQLSWWCEPDEEDGYGGRRTLLRIRGGGLLFPERAPAPPDTCKPMTQPLSPAAQAVLDAAVLPCTIREGIAAALRAAADHIDHDWSAFNCVDALCEIAAELEALQ